MEKRNIQKTRVKKIKKRKEKKTENVGREEYCA